MTPPRFHFSKRIASLRREMTRKRLDAFVTLFASSTRYLTGYSGSNGLAVVTPDDLFFLTDFRYKSQARAEVKASRTLIVTGSLVEAAAKHGVLKGCATVGFEGDRLSYASFRELKKNFRGTRFVNAPSLIESLAAVKEEAEIDLIRRAVAITDRVFREILEIVKPGMAEREIAAEIAYLHRKHGAEADAFQTIVASGVRGALPHGRASDKKIRRGELVTIDFGCVYRGYGSDLTRTIAVGRPDPEKRTIYQIVLEAQRRAEEAARPGMKAKDLDAVARGYIAEKGYGRHFGHGLGHGLGLEVHSLPRVSSISAHTLATGNVITIEPGIYIPGCCGVRIEDDVVLRRCGCEILTHAPKTLIIV